MDPIASAKISTPIQPCPLQKSPKNHRHPSPLSQARPTTGAPAVRVNPNHSATAHTKAQGFHPFPIPPKKTAPCISAPANKAPTASSATARTRRSPDFWWRATAVSSDFIRPRLRAGNDGADGAAHSNVEGRPPCRPICSGRACGWWCFFQNSASWAASGSGTRRFRVVLAMVGWPAALSSDFSRFSRISLARVMIESGRPARRATWMP